MDESNDVELWCPVVGYEELYQVSDLGRVWSNDRWVDRGRSGCIWAPGRFLKLSSARDGYPKVNLFQGGVGKNCKLHRLVLEAFRGPCPAGMEACHWDDDHRNARLANLRWATRAENNQDRVRHGVKMGRLTPGLLSECCPRGHELSPVNRSAGGCCLACARAGSSGRSARRRGELVEDIYATADAHYALLMAQVEI